MTSAGSLQIAMYTEGVPFTGDTLEQRALGGSETAFISVAREFAQLGHRVTAYCPCEKEGAFDGVTYRDLSWAGELERADTDLFLCCRYFGVFAKRPRARARFLWMHDVLVPQVARALISVIPALDLVYCVSEYHRALTLQALPLLGARLTTTFNGVDLDLIDRVVANVPDKRHKVMFTSRPERGLPRTLDLYERIGDRDLELLICSYSSLKDPNVESIEAACRARIADLVTKGYPVSTGSFKKEELYRHMAESKAILYPTDFPEVFCISAVEAQACGTAFLTIDAFALQETVGYERCPPGDDEAFLRRALEVLNDDTLRGRLEETGRTHARRYTWRAVAERFLSDVKRRLHREGERHESPALFDRIGPRPAGLSGQLGEHPAPEWREARARVAGAAATVAARFDRIAAATASALGPRAPNRGSGDGDDPAAIGTPARPKISCLTVTRCDRLTLLKRSILCFCNQTYPNRELVIVTEVGGRALRAVQRHLDRLDRNDVRLVALPPGDYTLGKVRNASLDAADGEVVCQWDDDDLYHPQRLGLQMAALLEQGEGCAYLTDQLQYFVPDRALHWIDWSVGGRVVGIWEIIPGSMMMFADHRYRYPEKGGRALKGEDSSLLEAMYDRVPIVRVRGVGHVHVYTYHGRNTFSAAHHRGQRDRSAPRAFMEPRLGQLREALRHYPLPRPTTVFSQEGPLFTLYA